MPTKGEGAIGALDFCADERKRLAKLVRVVEIGEVIFACVVLLILVYFGIKWQSNMHQNSRLRFADGHSSERLDRPKGQCMVYSLQSMCRV